MLSPPIPQNEPLRLNALLEMTILDTPAEERFDRLTRLALNMFGVSIAAVSLIDANRQWFKSKQGLEACETGRDISFCGHAILGQDIFHIPDARIDPRFSDNPLVTKSPNIRFYAGAPIKSADGYNIGTLCIIDSNPRDLTDREKAALRDLADCVEAEINQLQFRAKDKIIVENEKRLRHMLAISPIAVRISRTIDNQLVFVNQAYVDMLNTTEEDLIGTNPILYYKDPQTYKAVNLSLMDGSSLLNHQIELRTSDGRSVWVLASYFKTDYEGQSAIMGWFYDVTAIRKAQSQAEQANRAKSEFLSNMSHELRTPMNAILGFGQLLECDENLTPSQQEYVQAILKSGNHLLLLINEVLDLAKVESGHVSLSIEDVDVGIVIEECIALVVPIADQRHISIRHLSCHDIIVRTDRTRLRQVLLNLLSNAVKYNRESGSVSLDVQTINKGKLRISVTDTGMGISAERRLDLFKPFNRLGAENSGIEGTGIGLTITRRIIEMMGGSVDVESEVGIGSTFMIELPLEVMAKHSQLQNANHTSAPVNKWTQNSSALQHTILYIDDNELNIKLVSQILRRYERARLLTSMSPEEGIALARQHQPDLILLDINMPGMSGYEVLEVLKADQQLKTIPVIAVTANAMSSDVSKGLAAGFNDYLTKPFEIDKFLRTIDRHLQMVLNT